MSDMPFHCDSLVTELDEAFRTLSEVRRSLAASSENDRKVRYLSAHVDGFLGQAVPWPTEVISAIAQVYKDVVTVLRCLGKDKARGGKEARDKKIQELLVHTRLPY